MENRKRQAEDPKEQRRAETAERISRTYASHYRSPEDHRGEYSFQRDAEGLRGLLVLIAVIGVLLVFVLVIWLMVGGVRYMWDHPLF